MRLLRGLHDLRQYAAHILGMDEEDERAVCADARFTEDAGVLGFELRLGEGAERLVANRNTLPLKEVFASFSIPLPPPSGSGRND